jgi:hypothetical protein
MALILAALLMLEGTWGGNSCVATNQATVQER